MARKFFASTVLAFVAPVAGLGLAACGADDQSSDKMSTTQNEEMSDKDRTSGDDKMLDKDKTTDKDTMIDKDRPSDEGKTTDKDKLPDKDGTTDGSMKDKETDGLTRNGSMIDGRWHLEKEASHTVNRIGDDVWRRATISYPHATYDSSAGPALPSDAFAALTPRGAVLRAL